jgi:hypothetical protein
MATQQTRIITDHADYEGYKTNQSSDGHIEYAADARNHKVTMLIPFWGVFTVILMGQPPITLYLIVKVFLLNPSAPAKSAFQKTNNK